MSFLNRIVERLSEPGAGARVTLPRAAPRSGREQANHDAAEFEEAEVLAPVPAEPARVPSPPAEPSQRAAEPFLPRRTRAEPLDELEPLASPRAQPAMLDATPRETHFSVEMPPPPAAAPDAQRSSPWSFHELLGIAPQASTPAAVSPPTPARAPLESSPSVEEIAERVLGQMKRESRVEPRAEPRSELRVEPRPAQVQSAEPARRAAPAHERAPLASPPRVVIGSVHVQVTAPKKAAPARPTTRVEPPALREPTPSLVPSFSSGSRFGLPQM